MYSIDDKEERQEREKHVRRVFDCTIIINTERISNEIICDYGCAVFGLDSAKTFSYIALSPYNNDKYSDRNNSALP